MSATAEQNVEFRHGYDMDQDLYSDQGARVRRFYEANATLSDAPE